jgi:hypothetical protein
MALPRGLATRGHKVRIRTLWGSTRGGGLSGVVLYPREGQPSRVGALLVWSTPSIQPSLGFFLVKGYLFRLGTLFGYF